MQNFLLFRWYYRLFIWARFLWQVSRIKLDLVPTHPDRSAGLGFLSTVSFAFVPLLLAHGALIAGKMGDRILYAGAHLVDFKWEIIAVVSVVLLFVLGPLLVFSPQLEGPNAKVAENKLLFVAQSNHRINLRRLSCRDRGQRRCRKEFAMDMAREVPIISAEICCAE